MSSYKKRLKAKIARRIRNLQNYNDVQSNKTHLVASAVFRMSLKLEDSELIIMPVKEKRILKHEAKGLYIVLERTTLEIVNHSFSYHLEIGFDTFKRLSTMFDAKLDSLRQTEEQQMLDQISVGLQQLLDKIKE